MAADQPGNDSVDLSTKSLRALAHPMRVQIVQMLTADGPSTSARLAERLGVRSGSTSWHLTKLAEGGLVAEIPDRGTRRERWWQAVGSGWSIDAASYLAAPETRGDAATVLHTVMRQHLQRGEQFLGEEWPEDWRRAWILESCPPMRLTPEGLAELGHRLRAVVRDVTEQHATAGSDAETVLLQIQGFPVREDPES
ncbi:winged helix-turn-helix domain-containing protein [Luteipulveratus mongoliensis]|uniref:HTH arsR-type domain-containing protein n=1 Tax=Luteipulveratus mongoliensis TaxID=571913 RepID=A0A0K1JFG9_9MICO|nr:helix-turn-helix domain-containing protein [Luteipulveratus mongoliensis]AKU15454.1 hypothetical protein VV02_05535 [Luteipulveratus mongoliensis]